MYFTSKGILKNLCFFWCDWFVGMVINSKMLLIVVVFRHQDTMMCGFGRSTSCRRPSTMGGYVFVLLVYVWIIQFEREVLTRRHTATIKLPWETTCFNHNAAPELQLRSRSAKKRFIAAEPPSGASEVLKIVCLRSHLEALKCSNRVLGPPILWRL